MSKNMGRRSILKNGMYGLAAAGVVAVASEGLAGPKATNVQDIKILNNALFYEHRAIWAYDFAAGKLTDSAVAKAVLAIALANQSDHKAHRDTLTKVISSLGGTPVTPLTDYLNTMKPYLDRGEGNLDSDVNIAKLALALEVDAAVAYGIEISKFKNPNLITAGASIGSTEASHATWIRSAFKSLGVDLVVIPTSFINQDTRNSWILKV